MSFNIYVDWSSAFASKPAPTVDGGCTQIFCTHRTLWERACSRMQSAIQRIFQPCQAAGFTRFTGFSPAKAASRLSTAHLAIASRVSCVAEPMCGVATTLFSCNNGES